MPQAGQRLSTQDFPDSPAPVSSNIAFNPTSTTPAEGGNPVQTQFTVGLSGKVWIALAGGIRAASTGEVTRLELQVFEGVDENGTEVLVPGADNRIQTGSVNAVQFLGRTVPISGLNPGTHFVRVMHSVSGGAGHVNHRALGVMPLPS